MFTYGDLDRNLLAAAQQFDPSLTSIPMQPADAFDNDAVRGLTAIQLVPLRLGAEFDVIARRPTFFDIRFDEPLSQRQSSEMHFVLLEQVEHEYPERANNPNAFSMADILWRFFRQS
jgi:hypothetical protein